MDGESGGDGDSLRIDRWLWAARFFKTRALAVAAVNGGHVHVNGQRVKPARAVHVNDELRIRCGPYEFVVQVRGVQQRRGPAAEARQLYEETEASRAAREQLTLERRLAHMATPQTPGRPSKRDRRHIIRFRRDQD